jgi:glycosyltransferase involved in cell wall biosynthesis
VSPSLSSDAFPRRILVINPVGELGGAERVLLDCIASIRAVKPETYFHVLLFADGPLLTELKRHGATASVLPLPSPLHELGDSGLPDALGKAGRLKSILSLVLETPTLLTFLYRLHQEIRRHQPDLVQSNGIKAHVLSSLAVPNGVPLVWHIHDFIGARPLAGPMLRLVACRAKSAIAISEAVARDTRHSLPSLRVVTIPNAVDVNEFCPGPANGLSLDTLAGMPPGRGGTLRIGLVATYAHWKGHAVFLQAAARVRALLPSMELRFYVVGGPAYATAASQITEAELRGWIAELGISDVAGLIPFQRALVPILRSLDIIVHASTRPEPFGRTILEAMACGRAVVVAAAGGPLEFVRNHTDGLIHLPGSFEALAQSIAALASSDELRNRLGAEARRSAAARYSRDTRGPAFLAFYRSLTN